MSNISWEDEQEQEQEMVEEEYLPPAEDPDFQPDEFQEAEQYLDQQEEAAAAVMTEAVLRIEQANLYQTLLSHDLFGKGSARPEIINKVQTEMRAFILSRLEILLGIKAEKQISEDIKSSPFDDEQTEFLMALADRGLRRTGGLTAPVVAKPSLNPVQADPQPQQRPRQVAAPEPLIKPVMPHGGPPHTQLAKSVPQARRRPQPQQRAPQQPQQQQEEPSQPLGRKLANGQIEYNGKKLNPRKSVPVPRKRKSGNVSEIDGKDLSQAVNPNNPPVRPPSQAIVDQMHAQQVANATQGGNGKPNMSGIAALAALKG